MKRNIILIISCSILIMLSACNNSKTNDANAPSVKDAISSSEEKDLTGTFTAGGKTYKGKVSTQHFEATGQYSVLCQDDSDPNDSKLIQFVFKDENTARTDGSLTTAYDQGKDQTNKEVSIAFDISYHTEEDSKGTCTITKNGSSNELVFDNVILKNVSKEKMIVSGKIPF